MNRTRLFATVLAAGLATASTNDAARRISGEIILLVDGAPTNSLTPGENKEGDRLRCVP